MTWWKRFTWSATPPACRAGIADYRDAGVDAPLLLPRLEDYMQVVEALRP